ncbi:hypothetical protein C8R43DRAFT_1024430 [Mycena crocata]|nr:hypothetical protein C8R43DRAFT_1024430 [Mycena crocata]
MMRMRAIAPMSMDAAPPPPPVSAPGGPPPPSPPSSGTPPAALSRKMSASPDLSSYNYGAISSLVMTAERSSLPASASSPARESIVVDEEEAGIDCDCEDEDGEQDQEQEAAIADKLDPLETLARLQSFDGCFSSAVFTFVTLRTDIQALRALFPAEVSDGVVATVLAMVFLSTKLGNGVDRDSWEGMYEKGKEYVEEALVGMGVNDVTVEALETEVGKMLA